MSKNTTSEWAHDIPLLDPDTRRLSERAVNQQWAEQIERQADERQRWQQVLTPDLSRNSHTVSGPYRPRRPWGRYAVVAVACAVLVSVLLGLSGYGQDAVQLLGSAWVS